MSIIECEYCEGTHWGSIYCPFTDRGRKEIADLEARANQLKEQRKKMTIQYYPDELDYANEKIHDQPDENNFLRMFLSSCLRADYQNYELLRPVLQNFMRKYPVRIKK